MADISKSEYIRKHPNLSPVELSQKAASEGLQIKPNHVSSVRSGDKAEAAKKAGIVAPKRGPGRPPKVAPAVVPAPVARRKPAGRPKKATASAVPSPPRNASPTPKTVASSGDSERRLMEAVWDVAVESGFARVRNVVEQVERKVRALKLS